MLNLLLSRLIFLPQSASSALALSTCTCICVDDGEILDRDGADSASLSPRSYMLRFAKELKICDPLDRVLFCSNFTFCTSFLTANYLHGYSLAKS